MLPRLYGDGVLVAGDAAGLVINTGYIWCAAWTWP
jgi:flavin-dependent dehydrogenase